MTVDVTELINLLSWLSERGDIRVAVSQVAKGTLAVASCTAVGGLVMGPAGLGIGGAVGGAIASWVCWGTYKPAHQVILGMSEGEKRKMCEHVMSLVKTLDYSDVSRLREVIQDDEGKKKELMEAIALHLHEELRSQVKIMD